MNLAALDRTCLIWLGLWFYFLGSKYEGHGACGAQGDYSLIPKAAEMAWQSCNFPWSLETLIVELP